MLNDRFRCSGLVPYGRIHKIIYSLQIITLGTIATIVQALPTYSAEEVYLDLGLLEVSVPVDDLAQFAETGEFSRPLAPYLNRLNLENRNELRQALEAKAPFDQLLVSQFFNSPMGKDLLTYAGEILQTGDRENGGLALQTALVKAATDSEGLSLLNTIEQFPAETVRLDGVQVLNIARQITKLVRSTNSVVQTLQQLTTTAAQTQPAFNFTTQRDLRQAGPFPWQHTTLNLQDPGRSFAIGNSPPSARPVITDLYLPQPTSQQAAQPSLLQSAVVQPNQSIPVIVISHGLGSNRQAFGHVAEHLASYGFAVVAIEHPGSNTAYQQALFQGQTDEMFQSSEFVDRPLDVTFALDQLQQLNQSGQLSGQLSGQVNARTVPIPLNLNLAQVGVIGHSFGGYTALALAGAPIDFNQLNQNCLSTIAYYNISLLLQCRALELPRTSQINLRDPRVAAVIPVNPVASAVFGPRSIGQIQIPVLIGTGSEDPVAPALVEQIQAFTWMNTNDRYLAVARGATHMSSLAALQKALIPSITPLLGTDSSLYESYFKSIAVAFMQNYIANQSQYRTYLSASHAKAISQSPFNLSLVDASATPAIRQIIENFQASR